MQQDQDFRGTQHVLSEKAGKWAALERTDSPVPSSYNGWQLYMRDCSPADPAAFDGIGPLNPIRKTTFSSWGIQICEHGLALLGQASW